MYMSITRNSDNKFLAKLKPTAPPGSDNVNEIWLLNDTGLTIVLSPSETAQVIGELTRELRAVEVLARGMTA